MASGCSTSWGEAARSKATNSLLNLVTALALLLGAGWSHSAWAQSAPAAACVSGEMPAATIDAQDALARAPNDLAPRIRLANALIDQACYEQAVATLEAGLKLHPHSPELAGKLRDARSMLTEQSYIQNLTQAEDMARFQHDQLRCSKLGDLDACDAVLKVAPNDPAALAARRDVTAKSAHGSEPGAETTVSGSLAASSTTLPAGLSASPQAAPKTEAKTRTPPATLLASAGSREQRRAAHMAPSLASPAPSPTYSNEGSPGQTN
jgi:hypothetical protein